MTKLRKSPLQRSHKNSKIKRKNRDTEPALNPINLIEIITKSLAAIAGAVSLVYVFGFIIVNIHLSSYGIRAFNLGRPTYLSAGLLFVVAFVILASIPMLAFRRIGRSIELSLEHSIDKWVRPPNPWKFYQQVTRSVEFARVLTLMAAVSGLLCISLVIVFTDPQRTSLQRFETPFNYLVIVFSMFATGFIGAIVIYNARKKSHKETLIYLEWIVMVITSILFALFIWSREIYPNISAAYGGGAPVQVRLVISDIKNTNLFTESGLEVKNNVTSPIALLDNSGDTLVVLLEDDEGEKYAVELEKSLVANIVYLPKRNTTPTPTANPSTAPPGIIFVTVTPTPP